LIPWFDGAILSQEWKDALGDKFVTKAPRPRTLSEQQYNDRRLKLTPMLGHKRVSHFASLAKYALAIVLGPMADNGAPVLRMSRSSDTRTSSRFSRRISASFTVSPDTAFANRRFQA